MVDRQVLELLSTPFGSFAVFVLLSKSFWLTMRKSVVLEHAVLLQRMSRANRHAEIAASKVEMYQH